MATRAGLLGYILPERLSSLDAFPPPARLAWSDAQQTVLYLPLREGAPQAEALRDALRKRAASLLFLRRLRHVSYTDEATGESLHVRRQQQRSEPESLQAGQSSTPDGVDRWSVTVEELEYRQDGGLQQQQAQRRKHLRCAAELSVPPMFTSSASGPTTEIVIALPLAEADGSFKDSEDSSEHAEDICQVFCFLPVRNVGLRFALHAEFDLVTNRDDVHDSAWNRWLRDSAARLFVAAVAAQPPVVCAPALAFLPATLRVTEPFWQLFVDGAIRELRVSPLPVIRSESGELCPLSSLLRRPGCVSERLISNQELKSITDGKQFATGGGKDGAEDASLAALGLPDFGLQELVGCVHAWPTVFAPSWQVELYGALFELLKQAGTGEAGGLEAASRVVRSLRIFPLTADPCASVACESGPIFTSLQSRDETALDALGYSLRLLDQPIVDLLQETGAHQARMLLEVLGIRKVTPADLVNLVIREHEELMVGMKPSQDLTMDRLRAQLNLLQRNADQLPPDARPVLLVPVGGREQELRLLPLQDAQLSTVLGGLCHVQAEEPTLNVVELFGPLLRIEDEVNVEELLERLRIEQFLRERLGLKLVEGTVKTAATTVTERQLSAFLAAATEPQLFEYVRREFLRCLDFGAKLQIELESERVNIGRSFLASCFGYQSAFGATGLPCINLQLPTEHKAGTAALNFLEEYLGVAVAVTVLTVLYALRTLSNMELLDMEDGHIRSNGTGPLEPIYVRQLPLLSWLGNHLMTTDAQHDKYFLRDLLFFLPLAGASGGIRSVTVSSACWYEGEQAKWLSDVLDLSNLAEVYASARYLFTDVLKVRCTFSIDELCMALDTLSEVVMDGEIKGQQLTTSEQDCMADYFEHGLQGLAGRPSMESEMWRSMLDTFPLSGGRTKADIKAFVLGLLLRRNVANLLAVCTYAYEQLALSLGDDASAVDADFFDMRRILVPVAHPARGAFSTSGGEEVSFCRFSTSEDVYWFASTADEAELAAACGLHALSPHYPNALRRFFVDLLHAPARPNPSTSRLLEAIHTLAASPPTESTARVVAECERVCPHTSNHAARPVLSDLVLSHHCLPTQQPPDRRVRAQLLSRRDLSGLEEAGSMSTGCPRHGPGCHHPACHALGSLFGSREPGGSAGGGGGVTLSDLGLTASTPRECVERARQSIAQALSLGRRHGQQDFHRAVECDHAHAEAPTNESAAAD